MTGAKIQFNVHSINATATYDWLQDFRRVTPQLLQKDDSFGSLVFASLEREDAFFSRSFFVMQMTPCRTNQCLTFDFNSSRLMPLLVSSIAYLPLLSGLVRKPQAL